MSAFAMVCGASARLRCDPQLGTTWSQLGSFARSRCEGAAETCALNCVATFAPWRSPPEGLGSPGDQIVTFSLLTWGAGVKKSELGRFFVSGVGIVLFGSALLMQYFLNLSKLASPSLPTLNSN